MIERVVTKIKEEGSRKRELQKEKQDLPKGVKKSLKFGKYFSYFFVRF